MEKNVAIKAKEGEIQTQLDRWVRRSGLFSAGEGLKFSLTPIQMPTVVLETSGRTYTFSETRYYRYVTTTISESDWDSILGSSSLSTKYVKFLRHLKSVRNAPTPEHVLGTRISRDAINDELRSLRLRFRLERVRFDEQMGRYMQLFKVEPKPDVMQYWG